jgi:hypothetical protein
MGCSMMLSGMRCSRVAIDKSTSWHTGATGSMILIFEHAAKSVARRKFLLLTVPLPDKFDDEMVYLL